MDQKLQSGPGRNSPILVVPYMWIGDFVRCHSVVKLLNARFPDRPVDMLATTLCAPLADYMPGLRQAIVADLPRRRLALSAQLALARRLKREAYGSALIMPRTWKSALAPFFAGIPQRTGFAGEARFFLLNDVRFGERTLPRMVDRCAALALPPDATPPPRWPLPELKVPRQEIEAWRKKRGLDGVDRPVVALAPGAVGPAKRWPAESYAELARRLMAEGLAVWVLGGPGEKALAAEIVGRRSGTRFDRTRSARRHSGAGRRPTPPCPTIPAFCMSQPRLARRQSAFSDPPAPGIGPRSIRWRQRLRRPRSCPASPATSRSAASSTIAACAILRRTRSWIRSWPRPTRRWPRSCRRRKVTGRARPLNRRFVKSA